MTLSQAFLNLHLPLSPSPQFSHDKKANNASNVRNRLQKRLLGRLIHDILHTDQCMYFNLGLSPCRFGETCVSMIPSTMPTGALLLVGSTVLDWSSLRGLTKDSPWSPHPAKKKKIITATGKGRRERELIAYPIPHTGRRN